MPRNVREIMPTPHAPQIIKRAEATDTMRAWERFLTGEHQAAQPNCNFVVSSWKRSLRRGVDPTARAAPLAASGDELHALRKRRQDLLMAASRVFAEVGELLGGSRSIMLLTDASGIVLDAVGDRLTLEQGMDIHLIQGGDWREDIIGTNGIGTTLATGRPVQVHAAEHFCEGIKSWTCAGAPIFEPGTNEILGVLDISGPPSTYQRNNLTLAVSAARQIEGVLAERAARERMRLLEFCLHRISSTDAAGLIALDRAGRLVHATGRVPGNVGINERVPGLDRDVPVEHWASHLPEGWRPEWLNAISFDGKPIGAVLVVPDRPRSSIGRMPVRGSENDPGRSSFDHFIGRDAATTTLLKRASQLVGRPVPVLIEGETGVGKELLARAIHDDADDRRPFIVFNCGAVSRELVAAELFGHVPGAYTGATREGRPGRFELAHQGTLCLDEIGEMPLDLQPVLLRVLEEGIVYRVGDTQPRRVNARLIAITNRDLKAEVEAGRFRRDLYYRISVTSLNVPPLRQRVEDIEPLIEHFNRLLSTRHHVPMRRFAPAVMSALKAHPWPGNVRELRNLVERLLLTSGVEIESLDEVAPAAVFGGMTDAAEASPTSLNEAEREAIRRALCHEHGNLAGAARRLGVSRSTIYRKIFRYGLATDAG
jgi:sigma-54 dependent transcriptional regulator, acetoin dehydrogenase operon transcriptional activator AcoR